MISDKAIKELSVKLQTSELNIRREYLQHLFLSHFYKQLHTDKIYFKGGTALRIIYRSPRFSEDLDFGSSITDIEKIEQAVIDTLLNMERADIKTDLEEAKKTTGGYLAIIHFMAYNRVIPIQIEISFRDSQKDKDEITTINSEYSPPYTIMQLIRVQLIQGKIDALLSRQKPRDFYDLYYLLRANLIDTKQKKILKNALDVLKKTDINFNQELKQFLPKDHWAIIRDFPMALEREIERFIGIG